MKRIAFVAGTIALCAAFFLLKKESPSDTAESRSLCTKKESLRVGTSADFYPFEFLAQGELQGFDIDLTKRIAEKIGRDIVWSDQAFDMLLLSLQNGKLDLIASAMTPTPERSKQVLFSDNYFDQEPLVLISKHSKGITPDTLAGKTVLVNDGFVSESFAKTVPGLQTISIPTTAEALLQLYNDAADGFIADGMSIALPAINAFKQLHSDANFVLTPFSQASVSRAFALQKNATPLVDEINQALHELQESGELDALKRTWGLV
jgi:polar amino acid transport system substrate-binding protein